MSKELNVMDMPTTESQEVACPSEIIKLDDVSLALVGGGSVGVVF